MQWEIGISILKIFPRWLQCEPDLGKQRVNPFLIPGICGKNLLITMSTHNEYLTMNVEAETPILWPPDAKSWLIGKDPDAGKRAGGEGDDRGWDGWMASPTQWTWVWVTSRRWWWTGRPGVLQFMESQRVGHDWATELNWTWTSLFHQLRVLPCHSSPVRDRVPSSLLPPRNRCLPFHVPHKVALLVSFSSRHQFTYRCWSSPLKGSITVSTQ